jgi:hypothetical protein
MSAVLVVFYAQLHPSGTPTSKSQGELNHESMGDTEHYYYFFSLPTVLVGFQLDSN